MHCKYLALSLSLSLSIALSTSLQYILSLSLIMVFWTFIGYMYGLFHKKKTCIILSIY